MCLWSCIKPGATYMCVWKQNVQCGLSCYKKRSLSVLVAAFSTLQLNGLLPTDVELTPFCQCLHRTYLCPSAKIYWSVTSAKKTSSWWAWGKHSIPSLLLLLMILLGIQDTLGLTALWLAQLWVRASQHATTWNRSLHFASDMTWSWAVGERSFSSE